MPIQGTVIDREETQDGLRLSDGVTPLFKRGTQKINLVEQHGYPRALHVCTKASSYYIFARRHHPLHPHVQLLCLDTTLPSISSTMLLG